MQLETKNEYIMYLVHSMHLNNGHINKRSHFINVTECCNHWPQDAESLGALFLLRSQRMWRILWERQVVKWLYIHKHSSFDTSDTNIST